VGHYLLKILLIVFLGESKEVLTIAAYHVSDGIDHCCIGFLKSNLVKHSELCDGVLVLKVFRFLYIAIMSCLPKATINQISCYQEEESWVAMPLPIIL